MFLIIDKIYYFSIFFFGWATSITFKFTGFYLLLMDGLFLFLIAIFLFCSFVISRLFAKISPNRYFAFYTILLISLLLAIVYIKKFNLIEYPIEVTTMDVLFASLPKFLNI